jgi:hypothetical protein
MTAAVRTPAALSAQPLRVSPAFVALVVLAALLIAPALAGFEAPVHDAEDWRGNSAAVPAR